MRGEHGKLLLCVVQFTAPARGELADGADLETAVNMLVGSDYAGYLAGRIQRAWPQDAVDLVLSGL